MERGESERQEALVDGAAAALSSLCLLHCLLFPLVLSGFAAGSLHGPEWLHWFLIAVAAPVSVLALRRGMRVHGSPLPWMMAAAGFALMMAGALGHERLFDQIATVAGGLLVAAAHWRNWQARRLA